MSISWIFLTITILKMICPTSSLIGDHVCSRIENYTITSYETYTEPVIVNTFTWCLQIPPRCPKTQTELRQRYRVKTEEKSRIVEECCEGYKMLTIHDDDEERTNAKCLPFCEKCVTGICVAPNECQCNPGYRGDGCDHECPMGLWGSQCMKICDCGENGLCDPINGTCICPSGLQGSRCEQHCAIGQWGLDCANRCACQNRNNDCDTVTGRCVDDDISLPEQTSFVYPSTTQRLQTSRIADVESTEAVTVPRETIIRQTEDIKHSLTDSAYIPEATTTVTMVNHKITAIETQVKDTSTTPRPVIVLVSVPERRRDFEKERQKFATEDTFFNHVQNYDKTVNKDDISTTTSFPLDIALIIVAAIVSLGLTSIAVVMVLHMRSKLFETVRLSIYDAYDEKTRSPERESVNSERTPTVHNVNLPPPPIHANPVFPLNIEPETILTVDGIESLNTYANGPTKIGLHISADLRDLLQNGHYDRPSATLIRLQTNFDNTEHVYDEIPLQSTPLSNRKDV